MRLAVFLDAERERLDAPIFRFGYLAAIGFDNTRILFCQCFDLLGRYILPNEINMLVESHRLDLSCYAFPAQSPSSP